MSNKNFKSFNERMRETRKYKIAYNQKYKNLETNKDNYKYYFEKIANEFLIEHKVKIFLLEPFTVQKFPSKEAQERYIKNHLSFDDENAKDTIIYVLDKDNKIVHKRKGMTNTICSRNIISQVRDIAYKANDLKIYKAK